MTKQSYFWATPSGPINLMKAEDIPPGPIQTNAWNGKDYRENAFNNSQQFHYEQALQAAKASSVPIQDQERAKDLIAQLRIDLGSNATVWGSYANKEGAIYGPFSVGYRIETRCCANPNLAIGACERDCDAYESFHKVKGPSKVAILYDDTPEKEERHTLSKLKLALQDKIRQFEAYKTDPRYQTEMEQNAVVVTLRELRYLDSIAEYE